MRLIPVLSLISAEAKKFLNGEQANTGTSGLAHKHQQGRFYPQAPRPPIETSATFFHMIDR
jgi:hypothetical protein